LLCAAVAGAAIMLRKAPFLATVSPMLLAMALGMLIHNLIRTPAAARPGVLFAQKPLLRGAIVLLGLQLTLAQVAAVGPTGLATIVAATFVTFGVTVWLGRLLGVERGLTELIAAGASICGASAIVATNTVTNASEEDVGYALASITLFGTIAIFLYPLLKVALGLDAHDYGLWAGTSIHEVAQVVAAAFQGGQEAGELGTIVKLSRVMLLAPLVLGLAWLAARRARAAHADGPHPKTPVPWFVFGFIAMMLLNSVVAIPAAARGPLTLGTTFLFTMALAAMGLEIDVRKLKAKGLRPLALGAAASLFIAGFGLALVELLP
jgi:uncharacterized integral membrane protein (TIGR00698 family)